MTVEKISEELLLAAIQIPAAFGKPQDGSVLDFGFNFSAATADIEIALIAPDRSKTWSDKWQGINIEVDSPNHLLPAGIGGE